MLELNRIHQGDSWKLATQLDDDSVDCIVTSPPYWGLRDYGMEGQAGLEDHPQAWVDKMVELCRLLKPKLKSSGTMWWNIGETYFGSWGNYGNRPEISGESQKQREKNSEYLMRKGSPDTDFRPPSSRKGDESWLQPKQMLGLPWRFAIRMQDDGWILRNAIVWHKPNHMPSSVKDRLSNSYETIFMFVKNKKYYFDLDAIREPHQASTLERLERGVSDHHKNIEGAPGQTPHSLGKARLNTKQVVHPNRQVAGFNERWKEKQEAGIYKKFGLRANHGGDKSPDAVNPSGKNPGDVWRITTRPHPFAHFAVYPEALPERCIKSGCPPKGIVLDPFAGSGTTCLVAKRHSRQYLGFELSPEYITIANHRLNGVTDWKTIKEIQEGKQKELQ